MLEIELASAVSVASTPEFTLAGQMNPPFPVLAGVEEALYPVARLSGRFESRDAACRELFDYIEGFYDTRRLHSSLGYLSPAQFERHAALGEVA